MEGVVLVLEGGEDGERGFSLRVVLGEDGFFGGFELMKRRNND